MDVANDAGRPAYLRKLDGTLGSGPPRSPVRDQIELRAVSPIDFKKGVEASAAIEASNVSIGI